MQGGQRGQREEDERAHGRVPRPYGGMAGQKAQAAVIAARLHRVKADTAAPESAGQHAAADAGEGIKRPAPVGIPQAGPRRNGQVVLHVQQEKEIAIDEVHQLDADGRDVRGTQDFDELLHRGGQAEKVQAGRPRHRP